MIKVNDDSAIPANVRINESQEFHMNVSEIQNLAG